MILDKSCENSTSMSLRKGAIEVKAFSSLSVMLMLPSAALRFNSSLFGYSGSFSKTAEASDRCVAIELVFTWMLEMAACLFVLACCSLIEPESSDLWSEFSSA